MRLFLTTLYALLSSTLVSRFVQADNIFLSEREILQLFYSFTGGIDWTNNDNWLEDDTSICTWYGVVCRDGGGGGDTVTQLLMPDNGLNGTVPTYTFSLPSLREMNLEDNYIDIVFDDTDPEYPSSLEELRLTGTNIQSLGGIGKLSNLKGLFLSLTPIGGQIPTDLFALTELKRLDISQCGFSGVLPDEVGNLANLEEFYCDRNDIAGVIPDTIGALGELQVLGLSDNDFSGTLPDTLNGLASLQKLDLSSFTKNHSGIVGPLLDFASLSNLTELLLGGNSLAGSIPATLMAGVVDTTEEITIKLNSNRLEGGLPVELSRFPSLNIDLAENLIFQIPEELCGMSGWMSGLVREYGCDAILCPPGTFSEFGRQTSPDTACVVCLVPGSAPYFGSTVCEAGSSFSPTTAFPTIAPVSTTSKQCPDGHQCENGSKCVEIPFDQGSYYCECAESPLGAIAGLYCEHEATVYCTDDQTVSRTSFCVNGGVCKALVGPADAHMGCDCPSEYEGEYCQFVIGTTPNGWPYDATPSPSRSILPPSMAPILPNPPTSAPMAVLSTPFDLCPDGHHCENGSKCAEIPFDQGSYYCDCDDPSASGAFAGLYCEYEATVYCTDDQTVSRPSFCTNGGVCRALVGAEEAHMGCLCPNEYEGEYCQFLEGTKPDGWPFDTTPSPSQSSPPTPAPVLPNNPISAPTAAPVSSLVEQCPDGLVCENDSVCMEDSLEEGSYYCDCGASELDVAGLHCEHEATSYCNEKRFFCTNGGTCIEEAPVFSPTPSSMPSPSPSAMPSPTSASLAKIPSTSKSPSAMPSTMPSSGMASPSTRASSMACDCPDGYEGERCEFAVESPSITPVSSPPLGLSTSTAPSITLSLKQFCAIGALSTFLILCQ